MLGHHISFNKSFNVPWHRLYKSLKMYNFEHLLSKKNIAPAGAGERCLTRCSKVSHRWLESGDCEGDNILFPSFLYSAMSCRWMHCHSGSDHCSCGIAPFCTSKSFNACVNSIESIYFSLERYVQ